MRRFFKSAAFKTFAVVAAALLAGAIFATASRGGTSPLTAVTSVVFGPVHRLSAYVAGELKSLPISFRSSSTLSKQLDEANKQVDKLMEQLVDYEQAKQKNEFYQQFLELKEEHEDYTFAEAAVVGRDAMNRLGVFTLNRGSAHGVSVNDPVIYGRYLVGVVTSVTLMQSTVSTIMSPDVNVSAYEVRTRSLGFVTTTLELSQEGLCQMPGLPSSTAVTAGGVVCTSGVGGIYPRDLIIGTIVDVVDGTVDISASAVIKPGADISEITDVFIITDFFGKTNTETGEQQ